MLENISRYFISSEELDALPAYKYGGRDYSILANHLLKYYWDYVVELLPRWIAPNVLTLIGFGFIFFNYILVQIMIPDLECKAPSWVYFVLSLNLWLYHTFDNIDGRQARRTGSSSPLGELFDHGCDAISTSMMALVQIAALGGGTDPIHLLIPVCLLIGFYMSTWETWHVGGLILGYVNGATEGIVVMCISMIISGIYGVDIWKTDAPFISELGYNIKLYKLLYIIVITLLVSYQIPSCLLSVRNFYRNDIKRRNNAPSIFIYALQLLPMITYIGSFVAWATGQFSTIWTKHVFLFILTVGIVFGRIATKILLARITHSAFPKPTIALFPLIIGAYCANFIPKFHLYEEYYLYGCFLLAVSNYTIWAAVVIHSLCKRLNIKCLSIPVKQKYGNK